MSKSRWTIRINGKVHQVFTSATDEEAHRWFDLAVANVRVLNVDADVTLSYSDGYTEMAYAQETIQREVISDPFQG